MQNLKIRFFFQLKSAYKNFLKSVHVIVCVLRDCPVIAKCILVIMI